MLRSARAIGSTLRFQLYAAHEGFVNVEMPAAVQEIDTPEDLRRLTGAGKAASRQGLFN